MNIVARFENVQRNREPGSTECQVFLDHSPARTITGSTTGILTFTRLALRSLTLQPGHLLIGLPLTLSIGSACRLLSLLLLKLGGSWLLPPGDFPPSTESHPMDHDSDSSGHATYSSLTNYFPIRIRDPEAVF